MKSKIWDKTRYVLVFCVCVLDELLCTYSSMSSVTVIYLFFFFLSQGSFTSDDAEALSH